MNNVSNNVGNNKIVKFLIYDIVIVSLFVGYWYFGVSACKSVIYWVVVFKISLHAIFIIFTTLTFINGKLLNITELEMSQSDIEKMKMNGYHEFILIMLTVIIELPMLWYCGYITLAYILIGVLSTSILMADGILRKLAGNKQKD